MSLEKDKDYIFFKAGRLRKSNIRDSDLISLKKELQDYNMHTKTWSDE